MPPIGSDALLRSLIEAGALQVGEPLVFRRYSGTEHATVEADGRIKLASGQVVATPSAAVTAVGAAKADGWLKWRVTRLGNETLRSVRNRVLGSGPA